MASGKNTNMIVSGVDFDFKNSTNYTKPKINSVGGKSIGILNKTTNKSLFVSTPLMLTWGINEYHDEVSGKRTYDMSLQFPNDEYSTPEITQFLDNIKKFESKIKNDAVTYSKEWMNKAKMTPEVIDALFTPLLRYPKDPNSGEPDYSRSPTLRIKIPFWEGEWKCELYDLEENQIFPNESGLVPTELITKGSNIATVIQCGGIWFANGKFGVTWKLIQAVIKPKETLKGKCFITLSSSDKEKLKNSKDSDDEDNAVVAQVVDSDDEDEPPAEVVATKQVDEPTPPVEPKSPEKKPSVDDPDPPPAPKKKVVRKKKVEE
jgi:hypothetical protein